MAAVIQRLSRQALVTFMTRETAAFSSNFDRLKTMLDSITAEDLKLAVPNHLEQSNGSYTGAPATHVSIFECPFFSLGVFILRKGCSIPLHDHPGMFGLCKVVYGKISVESYQTQSETSLNGRTDGISRRPLHARRRRLIRCRKTEQCFEESGGSCVLTPTTGNHHSIHNISLGPSAFVDILGPPYAQDKGRDCTYFQECDPPAYQQGNPLEVENDDRWIIEISPPQDFFCDTQVVFLKDQLTDPLTEVTGVCSLPSLDKSQFYSEAAKAAREGPAKQAKNSSEEQREIERGPGKRGGDKKENRERQRRSENEKSVREDETKALVKKNSHVG